MGLVHVHKPQGLVCCEAQSKNGIKRVQLKSAIKKHDQEVQSENVINKCNQKT